MKWLEEAQTFAVVDYVKEMTTKKSCKYVEYGTFEYLLFLFECHAKEVNPTSMIL